MFLFHTLLKQCSHTVLKVYNQSVLSDTPSADKNFVTARFSSLVQTECGAAMLPLLGPYYTGHSISKWHRVQACIGMHNEQHSQYNKIRENFFTIISESLTYLLTYSIVQSPS